MCHQPCSCDKGLTWADTEDRNLCKLEQNWLSASSQEIIDTDQCSTTEVPENESHEEDEDSTGEEFDTDCVLSLDDDYWTKLSFHKGL